MCDFLGAEAFDIVAWDHGDTRFLGALLGLGLVPEESEDVRGGADKDDAGSGTGLGEAGVFGEETVAGVDRLGSGAEGSGDYGINV